MKKTLLSLVMVVCMASASLAADEAVIKTAKQIYKTQGDTVVWVSAVSKMELSGMGMLLGNQGEQEVEAVGTVIHESGLTVVSSASLNPMSMLGDIAIEVQGESQKINTQSQLSEVKMILADGTEIDCKLVLEDRDLNLSFIMPEKKEDVKLPKFKYISLKEGGKSEILDSLILLDRLGKSLNKQCQVLLSRVSAVVKKPRIFYCASELNMGGTPVFTENGKILGITSIRKPKAKGIMAMTGITPVVIPAGDVMEIAEQALEANKTKKETKEEVKEDK
ncbi:MAG: hypothetical protein KAS23_07615 [Anaerohalosphaera sp.]|nr:hypothetical protein [Anaerohalosphaera sp.]